MGLAKRLELTPFTQLDLTAVRVLDGGMATELEKLGCDLSGPLWSAHVLREQPEMIAAVHDSYLEAGADCILTASYQVSAEAYAEIDLTPEDAAASFRESVRIAEDVRARYPGRRILIVASLGPYGAALHNGAEYHGNYDISFDRLVSFHARRLAVLTETNADMVAFETVPSFEEARAIVAALEQYPEIAAWVSFTCRDESHTAHGEPIADCARLLEPVPQVVAMGINCTAPAFVTPLIQGLKASTAKPIVVYPNSGEGWDAKTRSWIVESTGASDAASFRRLAQQWRDAGAQIIGGCCRTGPEHVRVIRDGLRQPAVSGDTKLSEAGKSARRTGADQKYVLTELAGMAAGTIVPSLWWAIPLGLLLGYWQVRGRKSAHKVDQE